MFLFLSAFVFNWTILIYLWIIVLSHHQLSRLPDNYEELLAQEKKAEFLKETEIVVQKAVDNYIKENESDDWEDLSDSEVSEFQERSPESSNDNHKLASRSTAIFEQEFRKVEKLKNKIDEEKNSPRRRTKVIVH